MSVLFHAWATPLAFVNQWGERIESHFERRG
jgi:hypothetical protein